MNVFWSTYIVQRLVRLQRLEARARCCYGARMDTGLARSLVVESPCCAGCDVPANIYAAPLFYFILNTEVW
jgi:hypothetical protein